MVDKINKGKLVVIEAGDGSGKATQTELLFERLLRDEFIARKVAFPDYASPSSSLVTMYLNGEFGLNPEDVNPFAASAFYAVDRFASFKKNWGDFYATGGIIVADRYTTSNMVHQAVKFTDIELKNRYLDWLWDFEFNKIGLPEPDCVIFLDMPPQHAIGLMKNRENKHGGQEKDIHERNDNFLVNSYKNSLFLAEKYNWIKIKCTKDGTVKTKQEIHDDIYKAVLDELEL